MHIGEWNSSSQGSTRPMYSGTGYVSAMGDCSSVTTSSFVFAACPVGTPGLIIEPDMVKLMLLDLDSNAYRGCPGNPRHSHSIHDGHFCCTRFTHLIHLSPRYCATKLPGQYLHLLPSTLFILSVSRYYPLDYPSSSCELGSSGICICSIRMFYRLYLYFRG